MTIGSGVTSIGPEAFYACSALTDVYYLGTEAERNSNLSIYTGNAPLLNATWHYLHAQIISNSLTLEGKIQMNFYVSLSEDAVADEGSYALVTFNGKTTKHMVKDAPESEKNGIVRRQFIQDVFAKQMRDEVTIEFYTGNDTRIAFYNQLGEAIPGAYTYSVMDYSRNRSAGRYGSFSDSRAAAGGLRPRCSKHTGTRNRYVDRNGKPDSCTDDESNGSYVRSDVDTKADVNTGSDGNARID